jgi:hypothetical protein
MDFQELPTKKLFAVNSRINLPPKLWCICRLELDPEIISSDAQQVSFTIKLNDTLISFYAIYASTNYKKPLELIVFTFKPS